MEVIFDEDFRNLDAIGVHPNDNTASVFLAFSDLVKIIEEHGNSVTFLSLYCTRKNRFFWEFAIEEQVVLWYTKSKCGQFLLCAE